jgi:ABC-2 type transport system ATP-binding protein
LEGIVLGASILDAVLSVVNAVKRFGNIDVLKGVSINVLKGSITTLLGPNGSGKTTLMRIVAGVLKPTSGEVVFRGKVISYLPQEAGLFKELSGWDNMMFYAKLYGLDKERVLSRGKELLEKLGILSHAKSVVGKYSGGMARKLSLAIALLPDADLYILDEPTTGLDPQSRRAVWSLIEDVKKSGKAVLLSTHYMEEAEKLSSYVYLMHRGSIIAEGTVEDLKMRYAPRSIIEANVHEDVQKAVEVLKTEKFEVFTHKEIVKVYSDNPKEDVPKITLALHKNGVYVKTLNVVEPTLEDVFIKLTGERLSTE